MFLSKIRGHCWADPSEEVLRKQLELVKNALTWEVDAVSKRTLKIREVDPLQPISGHNGEWLGVLAGAWGSFLRMGDEKTAMEIQHLLQCELEREAQGKNRVLSSTPIPIRIIIPLPIHPLLPKSIQVFTSAQTQCGSEYSDVEVSSYPHPQRGRCGSRLGLLVR